MVHKGQPLLEYKAKEEYGKMISNSFQSMLDELPKLHFLSGETSKSQSGRAIPRLPWLPSSGRQILEPSFLSTKVTNYGSVKPVKPFNISYHKGRHLSTQLRSNHPGFAPAWSSLRLPHPLPLPSPDMNQKWGGPDLSSEHVELETV